MAKRFRLDQTRQTGGWKYQVVHDGGKWRAREWLLSMDAKEVYLMATAPHDTHEDAMEAVRLWRAGRRQSAIIGFRCG
jgi:hypothetical protein